MHQDIEGVELGMASWLAVLQRIEPAAAVFIQNDHFAINQLSAGNFSQARAICRNLSVKPFPFRDHRTVPVPRFPARQRYPSSLAS